MVDVIPIIKLVVEPSKDLDFVGGVPILDDDEVVGLEEGAPFFQKV